MAAAVSGLVLVFEDRDLLISTVFHYFCNHTRAVHQRRANLDIAASGNEQHVTQLYNGADVGLEQIDIQKLIAFNAILFAAGADYGVNDMPPRWAKSGESVR